jgi:hypothetical protein
VNKALGRTECKNVDQTEVFKAGPVVGSFKQEN